MTLVRAPDAHMTKQLDFVATNNNIIVYTLANRRFDLYFHNVSQQSADPYENVTMYYFIVDLYWMHYLYRIPKRN